MNLNEVTTMNNGKLANPGESPEHVSASFALIQPERDSECARIFLTWKLGLTNFDPAPRFHSMNNPAHVFTSFSCPAVHSLRKSCWHGSCSTEDGASTFRRWSAGLETHLRGCRPGFTESWTAPISGSCPRFQNQPSIK